MGFELNSGKRKTKPEINVTPLVDVVLVLLIIFMVITPLLVKQFWTHLPKQEKKEVQQKVEKSEEPLVLQILPEKKLLVNGVQIGFDELPERLRRMFAARDDHALFVDIKDDANYGFAVEVMDRAREGGAVTIAILTKPLAKN